MKPQPKPTNLLRKYNISEERWEQTKSQVAKAISRTISDTGALIAVADLMVNGDVPKEPHQI